MSCWHSQTDECAVCRPPAAAGPEQPEKTRDQALRELDRSSRYAHPSPPAAGPEPMPEADHTLYQQVGSGEDRVWIPASVAQHIDRAGYLIVPVASVVTAEERRVLEDALSFRRAAIAARATQDRSHEWDAFDAARVAFYTSADAELARRAAKGGKT